MNQGRFGAVVAAAGLSTRMEQYKLTMELKESTIIRTGLEGLLAAGAMPLVVVTGHRAKELEAHICDLPVRCLFNPDYATKDMFHSVKLGLSAMIGQELDGVFFLPGDTPLFYQKSLLDMEQRMLETGCELLVPRHRGKNGHPILIGAGLLPKVVRFEGEGGLKQALNQAGAVRTVYDVEDVGVTLDADVPEDYRRLVQCSEHYPSLILGEKG